MEVLIQGFHFFFIYVCCIFQAQITRIARLHRLHKLHDCFVFIINHYRLNVFIFKYEFHVLHGCFIFIISAFNSVTREICV